LKFIIKLCFSAKVICLVVSERRQFFLFWNFSIPQSSLLSSPSLFPVMSINPPIEAAALVTNLEPAQAPPLEPITGKHMRLERLAPSHIPDLWESIGQHEDLWIWWPEGPFNKGDFEKNMGEFKDFMKDDLGVYAVILLSGPHKDQAAGLALALSEHRDSHRIAELGAFFGPWLQRTKAATEALFVLGELMFKLNHRRLGWKTNSLNLASRRAAERYGFALEGILRQYEINKGRSRDAAWYGMIDSEWPSCKEAFELWLDDGNFDGEGRQRRKLEDIRAGLKKV
jgi:RimJ/RimL family protein N-acetyltransferase